MSSTRCRISLRGSTILILAYLPSVGSDLKRNLPRTKNHLKTVNWPCPLSGVSTESRARFCGNATFVPSSFASPAPDSQKFGFTRLAVQLVDQPRERIGAWNVGTAAANEQIMQGRDAVFAAPFKIAYESQNGAPQAFRLPSRPSIANLRFRSLRGPFTLVAFRPIPNVKVARADNKKPAAQRCKQLLVAFSCPECRPDRVIGQSTPGGYSRLTTFTGSATGSICFGEGSVGLLSFDRS
jgi:hypothetical protein